MKVKIAVSLLILVCQVVGMLSTASAEEAEQRDGLVQIFSDLEPLALQGDAEAQNRLGAMYGKGLGAPQNNKLAVSWLRKAAKQGHAAAQFNLGFMYREGRGVKKSYGKAEYWFGKAAAQGNAHAQSNLGVLYSFGQGVSRNDREAMDLFQKAAHRDSSRQDYLGFKFDIGLEKPVDYKQAVVWYRTAAENFREGSWGSDKDDLSIIYVNGLSAPQRFNRTIGGLQKSQESTVALEQFETGFKYYSGRYGLPWDYKLALYWFKKAAGQGNAAAQYNVGYMYHYGEGAPQDFKMAVEWYRKAAQQGFSHAQNNLGVMYSKGFGVPQDTRVARDWIRKAAEGGNARAQNTLALMYETGLALPQDFKLAVTWYRSAVEAAGTDAQWNAGWRDGQIHNDPPHGLDGFDQLGVDDLRKAAEKNNAGAQTLLGEKYSRGDGVQVDYQKAAYWYRRAASQGNARAQHHLAGAYRIGDGVPRSRIVSYALANLASDREAVAGVGGATFARMNASELEAGQALTRELAVPGRFLQALDAYIAKNGVLSKNDVDSGVVRQVARIPKIPDGHFPAPPEQMNSCNTRCVASQCWRTFGDGRQLRFQAIQKWSASKQQFVLDSGSC